MTGVLLVVCLGRTTTVYVPIVGRFHSSPGRFFLLATVLAAEVVWICPRRVRVSESLAARSRMPTDLHQKTAQTDRQLVTVLKT